LFFGTVAETPSIKSMYAVVRHSYMNTEIIQTKEIGTI
jgi:hypothetical protein